MDLLYEKVFEYVPDINIEDFSLAKSIHELAALNRSQIVDVL